MRVDRRPLRGDAPRLDLGRTVRRCRARGQPFPRSGTVDVSVDSARCDPTEPRRLVILTEGQFGDHHAKTAYGVIRYGRDDVVAVLDSTQAGRNVDEFLPGHDIPIVATLDEALALPSPPDALLIGIAPTGGKLPAAWRATILEAIAAGLDVLSGLHTFLGDDPEFAAAAAARGTAIVDYRRPPDRMETAVGRRHAPGQAGHPDGRRPTARSARCRSRSSCASRAVAAGAVRRLRADRPDRDDDRRLGRRGRPADQRLHPGHRRVAGRAGRGAGRLDPRRGSGLARPPGLLVGDARRSSTGRRRTRWSWSTSPGMTDHDFDHLPDVTFPIAPLPEFIALHEQVAGLVAPSKVVAVALNTSLYPRRRGRAPAHRRDRGARPGCRPTTRSASAATGSGPSVRDAVDALPWVLTLRSPRGPAPLPARPVPHRPHRPSHRRGRHDRHRRAARRALSGHRRAGGGLPGPVLRRDARDDGGGHPDARSTRSASRSSRPRRAWPRQPWPRMDRRDPLERGGQVRRRHRPARPRRQGPGRARSTS